MATFLVTFLLFALAIGGMAIGVALGRAPIAGSCGGLNNTDGSCSSCSRPCSSRRKATARAASAIPSASSPDEHPLRRA